MWNRLNSKPEYLGTQAFLLTVLAACLLHVLALYGWGLLPKLQVVDIPVHALNVKLGDSEVMEAMPIVPQDTVNSAQLENAISHLVRDQDVPARAEKAMDKAMAKAAPKAAAPAKAGAPPSDAIGALDQSVGAREFVRENNQQAVDARPAAPPARGEGSKLGSSDAQNAEMMSRYEQLISLWIQKFKLYPQEARAQHMQGETVVRVRIDRQGNIRYYTLEHTTGSHVLDRAAIDMIRRANPVPAVPDDYPQGELQEFLIPVSFKLQ